MKHLFNQKVTIRYNAEGSRDDFGIPARTLTTRSSNVPARIVPRSNLLSYEFPTQARRVIESGLTDYYTDIIYVSATETLLEKDVIVDADSLSYTVAIVIKSWGKYKAGLLRRIA